MIPRRVLILNGVLLAVCVVGGVYIVRELRAPLAAAPTARTRPPVTQAAAPTRPAETPGGRPANYSAVASRNLFSPTRTEAPPVATTAGAPAPVVKPNLHGVILRDGAPIAYLEDPSTKRTAGYRVGDTILGGSVQTIAADHVLISRPDGIVDVRLRDPAKPKPAAPAATGAPAQRGAAASQTVPPAAPLPGVIPPAAAPAAPPTTAAEPQAPAAVPPTTTTRRPLPPNLLRRLPAPPSNAPQQ